MTSIVSQQFASELPSRVEGTSYIDTANEQETSDWSDSNEDDDVEDAYDDVDRVEDEDWEIAERDFTKQYNRLRQHTAIRTGNAQGASSALNEAVSVATIPPVNRPKVTTAISAATSKVASGKDRTVDQLAALSKYNMRLAKIDVPYIMGVGVNRKGPSAHANVKDKSDRATNEQVLDPRTRLILFKMIGRGLIHEVNGCISTGKEANVYHALSPDSQHLAIKIYKTSILIFKDRDKYVTGEYRFRRGYSRNPRKMVRLWAEKEMRNLKRLVAAGINTPEPLEVRENVLVMKFIGDEEGWASPRLKDASLPSESITSLYAELVIIIRRMFHTCKLVHADLSEYNILYHEGHLWIIDVSQSVEHDHPSAFDFLRNDIKNVEEFFGRLGVKCLGLRKCFEFVTRKQVTVSEEDEEIAFARWLEGNIEMQEGLEIEEVDNQGTTSGIGELSISLSSSEQRSGRKGTRKEDTAHEDSVFLHSFIPRNLTDVYDPERDVEKLKRGDDLIYSKTIGFVRQKKEGEDRTEDLVDEKCSGEESASGSEHEVEEDSEENAFIDKKPRGHKYEVKEVKKERKRQVKAEQAERRTHKMPKSEKKRLLKKTKGG